MRAFELRTPGAGGRSEVVAAANTNAAEDTLSAIFGQRLTSDSALEERLRHLAQLRLPLRELGAIGSRYSHQRALRGLAKFERGLEQTLRAAEQRLSGVELDDTRAMLHHYRRVVGHFKSGSNLATVSYYSMGRYQDLDDQAGTYLAHGLTRDDAKELISNYVGPELVAGYAERGLLSRGNASSAYPFLRAGISAERFDEYVSHLPTDAIRSSGLAPNVVNALKRGITEEFIVELQRANFSIPARVFVDYYPWLDFPKTPEGVNPYVWVRGLMWEHPDAEAFIGRYSQANADDLGLMDVVTAWHFDVTPERLDELSVESRLKPRHVLEALSRGIPLDRVGEAFRGLGVERGDLLLYDAYSELDEPPSETQIEAWKLAFPDANSADLIWSWSAGLSLEEAKSYTATGVRGLWTVLNLAEAGTPPSYVAALLAPGGLSEKELEYVCAWFRAGLSAQQVREVHHLAEKHEIPGWRRAPELVPELLATLDGEQRETFLHHVSRGYELKAALHGVRTGATDEQMTAVRRRDGEIHLNSLTAFTEQPELWDTFLSMKPEEQEDAVLRLRDPDPSKWKELLRGAFNSSQWDPAVEHTIHRSGLEPASLVEYRDLISRETINGVGFLAMLGVPRSELPDLEKLDVDAYIRTRRARGDLPPKAQSFFEKYDLSMVSRYPLPILANMVAGPSEPRRPVALVVMSKSDWNGSFERLNALDGLVDGYDTVVIEARDENAVRAGIQRVASDKLRSGEAFGFLAVAGHGAPDGIELSYNDGEQYTLDYTDIDVLSEIGRYVDHNTVVAFQSCSTAGEDAHGESFAATAFDILGARKVMAADRPTFTRRYRFNEAHEVTGMDFGDVRAEVHFDSRF